MSARTAPWETAIRSRSDRNSGRPSPRPRAPTRPSPADGVADPPNRLDQLSRAGLLQLATQVVHVEINDLRRRVEREPPDVLLDLGARQDPSGASQQRLEELELLGRELDRFAPHDHAVGVEVHVDRPEGQLLAPSRAAGERLD